MIGKTALYKNKNIGVHSLKHTQSIKINLKNIYITKNKLIIYAKLCKT